MGKTDGKNYHVDYKVKRRKRNVVRITKGDRRTTQKGPDHVFFRHSTTKKKGKTGGQTLYKKRERVGKHPKGN